MIHPALADPAVVSNHEFDRNFSCQAGVLPRFVGDAWVEHLLPRGDDRIDCGAIEGPRLQSIRVRCACAWLGSRLTAPRLFLQPCKRPPTVRDAARKRVIDQVFRSQWRLRKTHRGWLGRTRSEALYLVRR